MRVLPREICPVPWDLACERNWLSAEQWVLTAWQKSAQGVVGSAELLKARTVTREGLEREGYSLGKEQRQCIRRVFGAQALGLG